MNGGQIKTAQRKNNQCSRQSNGPPKEICVLIPRICGYVRLHGKGELKLQMELRLLRKGDYYALSG